MVGTLVVEALLLGFLVGVVDSSFEERSNEGSEQFHILNRVYVLYNRGELITGPTEKRLIRFYRRGVDFTRTAAVIVILDLAGTVTLRMSVGMIHPLSSLWFL